MIKIYTNGNLAKETMSSIKDIPYELCSIDECNIAIIMTDNIVELKTNEGVLSDWNQRVPVIVCVKMTDENEDEICKFLSTYEITTGVECFAEYKHNLVKLVTCIIGSGRIRWIY